MKHLTIAMLVLFSCSFVYAQNDTIRLVDKRDFAGPVPVAKLGGKSGSSTISRGELNSSVEVVVGTEFSDLEKGYTIVSFDLTAKVGGYEKVESATNSKLTEAQKKLITQLKVGDKIYIEKIVVKSPDGILRNLSPIDLKVVN